MNGHSSNFCGVREKGEGGWGIQGGVKILNNGVPLIGGIWGDTTFLHAS